ncbi:MAG: polyprenyl synthetase family protein [Ignavibacteria bacterium]|jgi:geranylgeranyl diphosphate synthase type II|nr:polyprenyl synthetase family protein [Ignavibacteria bacterium]
MLNYEKENQVFLNLIEEKITEIIPQKQPEALYSAFNYVMTAGGKRIRPVLTMLACALLTGKPQHAVSAGLAIEIIHNFTLVHDDIMDNSSIRRGRETVHIKWDESTAILTGDMMVGWAYRMLPTSAPRYAELVEELNTALVDVCEGQQFDMEFNSRSDVTIDEYIEMIKLKTSALLRCSVRLGALIGNCSKEQYDALDNFALNLGIAFQIQDDMLDMTADQLKFGKKIGQDIIEGKKSFIILKALELATEEKDIALLQKYMHTKNGLPETYIPQFKEIFDNLNIFEIGQKIIDEYINKANSYIQNIQNSVQNDYYEMLKHFVNSLNKRVY